MYSHGFLKVAAASPVARVGDTKFNVSEMMKLIQEAEKKQVALVCFPELCIAGYSVGDLVFQDYLYQETLESITYLLKNITYQGVLIFGSYIYLKDAIYNCAFITQKGKILGIVPKNYLPHTYEFSEERWFSSGVEISKEVRTISLYGYEIPFGKLVFTNSNHDVMFAAEICADMWAPVSPNETLFANGALIVCNPSASPSHVGKADSRRLLTSSISMKFNGAYIYTSTNASESTSDTVFSSHKIITENGKILSEDDQISMNGSIIFADIDISKLHFLRRNNGYFKIVRDNYRDINIQYIPYELVEVDTYSFEKEFDKYPFVPKSKRDFMEMIDIQAISVVKRLQYIGIQTSVLGVSGGLDSTLALLSLCYAYDKHQIDRKNIIGVTLPSENTSTETYQNALELMKKLKITFLTLPITDGVTEQLNLIDHNTNEKDVTYENIQARYRTLTLMNLANKLKGIVIGTSDMSEVALGWSTFNGDQMAMYGINAGISKTAVKEMVRIYQEVYPEVKDVLNAILEIPISPELAGKNQRTEDIIGKYEVNDFILHHFLENGADEKRLCFLLKHAMGFTKEEAETYVDNFNKRFYSQQYKRLTMPEGVKVLSLSLSPRSQLRLNGDIYRSNSKK